MYDAVYPLDIVYLKAKREDKPLSLPLCEIINGKIVKAKCTPEHIVVYTDGQNVDEPEVTYKLSQFKTALEKVLRIGELEEVVIQPAGEVRTQQVEDFLKKYNL